MSILETLVSSTKLLVELCATVERQAKEIAALKQELCKAPTRRRRKSKRRPRPVVDVDETDRMLYPAWLYGTNGKLDPKAMKRWRYGYFDD